jgi:hypothetical protein
MGKICDYLQSALSCCRHAALHRHGAKQNGYRDVLGGGAVMNAVTVAKPKNHHTVRWTREQDVGKSKSTKNDQMANASVSVRRMMRLLTLLHSALRSRPAAACT